ncbi:MAG: trehalose-phosphatase [Actinomycetota bacterium]
MRADLIATFKRDPGEAGLFLDFDGTLSDIVTKPSEARPVPGVVEILDELSARLKLVAVVSGRSAHELLDWLPGVEVWGVHGAERTLDGEVVMSERAQGFADLMRKVRIEAETAVAATGIEGVLVEDKGVMIGLHFRAAASTEIAAHELDRIAAELAERHGLLRAAGKLAYELRPPVEFSKAAVVLERTREENLRAAAFFGDDVVDLPGYDALDVLEAEGIVGMRVAVDSAEAPEALIVRADIVVPGPAGAVELLRELAG